ncbi:MAG: hypothetical protein ACKOX3_02285 [Bacteroidota bacterium]
MEIKFAKPFKKLLNADGNGLIHHATLLQILKINNRSSLSAAFIEYDTDNDYMIPTDVPLLMLVFLKPYNSNQSSKNTFVTIRNWTQEKEEFYTRAIGLEFNVIVENESPQLNEIIS